MATIYQISISLSSETVQQLQAGDYSLQVFKGAKSNQSTALPALWCSFTVFGNTVELNWENSCSVFIAEEIKSNGVIIEIIDTPVAPLGSVITMLQDGTISVAPGDGDYFTVQNETNTAWSCGLLQQVNGSKPVPTCALPLPAGATDIVGPFEALVLAFSQVNIANGTLVAQTTTPSVTVILTGDVNSVSVSYDFVTGWSNSNGSPNVIINPFPINLAQTLIVPVR
jgi:hypothetical protein